jgi:hypothetical protein
MTVTFPWDRAQPATIVSVNSAGTKLESGQRMSVSKGNGSDEPAFTVEQTFTNLTSAPAEPRVTVCAS